MERLSARFIAKMVNSKNHYHETFLAYFGLIKKAPGNFY